MKITDQYIASLFSGYNFGVCVNSSTNKQRDLLIKNINNVKNGYACGSTIGWIMTRGGFVTDIKSKKPKLTLLGEILICAESGKK